MGYETERMQRTLFILQDTLAGKTVYSIYPFTEVKRGGNEYYLEPLPNDMLLGSKAVLRFDRVEFIGPDVLSVKRDANASAMNLTQMSPDQSVNRSA